MTSPAVVVVEDDPDVREVIRLMLSFEPRIWIAAEVESGQEALAAVTRHHGCVVILDQTLRGGPTGLEMAPLLKDAVPTSRILLFTAHDMSQQAEAEAAIDAYLRKDRLEMLVPTVLGLLGIDAA